MANDGPLIIETGRRSSGAGWVIALVLVVALVAGVVFFSQMSGSKSAKDDAIANAAGQVGDAAQKAGNAAQDAANNTKK
jgi:flagellar basal body-associated protein FliL